MEERICARDEFLVWSERLGLWRWRLWWGDACRMRWPLQEESEQNEVDVKLTAMPLASHTISRRPLRGLEADVIRCSLLHLQSLKIL